MRFWLVVSSGLAGILDLAVGLALVHALGGIFSYPLEWWQYAIGAFLGASPDIDLILAVVRKRETEHHEYLTHRPIVGIPAAAALGWLAGGEFWAWCAGLGVFWHYCHDTEGFLGLADNGIAWLWPFSRRYWGIRNFRVVSKTLGEHVAAEDNSFDSIYDKYLTPTRRSVTEFVCTSACVGWVAADLLGLGGAIAAVAAFWLAVAELWIVYRRPVRL